MEGVPAAATGNQRPRFEDRHWRAILDRIARHHMRLPPESREQLRSVLRTCGQPKGFADPLKAPQKLLRDALQGLRRQAGQRADGLLLLEWRHVGVELMAIIEESTDAEGGNLPPGNLVMRAQQIHRDHPEFSANEAEAAIICWEFERSQKPGARPPQGRSEREQRPPDDASGRRSALLVAWLDELQALSADATDWDHLDWFWAQVQELRRLKQAEREAARRREALAAEIAALHRLRDTLAGLGIRCEDWSAEHCPDERLAAALERVTAFRELVERYDEVERGQPLALSERIEQLDRLSGLLRQLGSRHQELGEILHAPEALGATRPEGQPGERMDESAKEEEATSDQADAAPTASVEGDVLEATAEPEVVDVEDVDPGAAAEAEMEAQGSASVGAVAIEDGAPANGPGPVEVILQETRGERLPEESGRPAGITPTAQAHLAAEHEAAFWRSLEEGDLAGGYWVAEALGPASPIPAVLVRAALGSRWLVRGASHLEADLLEIVQSESSTQGLPVQQAFAVAAALLPALSHPRAGMIAWLDGVASPFQCVAPVVDLVRQFASMGQALRPEDVGAARGREDLEEAIAEQTRRANRWLEQAPQRRFLFATEVFQYLTRTRDGVLTSLLTPVSGDRRSEAGRLAARLHEFLPRAARVDLIRQTEREISRHPLLRPVVGRALEQLIGAMDEGLEIGRAWCDAVQAWRTALDRGEPWRGKVHELVRQALAEGTRAEAALRDLTRDSDVSTRAGARCLSAALEDLERYLRGEALPWQVPPWAHKGVSAGLSSRLLWVPDLALEATDEGYPKPVAVDPLELLELVSRGQGTTPGLGDVVQKWIDRGDFRWVDQLIEDAASPSECAGLRERVQEARDKARRSLQREVDDLDRMLEEAVVAGTVDADTRSAVASGIEAVREDLRTEFYSVDAARSRLGDQVKAIVRSRDSVLQERHARWEKLSPAARKRLTQNQGEELTQLVEDALEKRDVYLVDEILAAVERSLTEGTTDPVAALLSQGRERKHRRDRDVFVEFLDSRERLRELGESLALSELESMVKRSSAPTVLGMEHLPQPRWREVAEAIASWRHLKQSEGRDHAGANVPVWSLMRYLGFRLQPDSPEAIKRVGAGRGWSVWESKMSAEPISPVAHFGSARGGVHRVLCLWERPGLLTIEMTLREAKLEGVPLLIVYLGRLLPRQWDDLVRHAYRTGLQGAVLDELLLLFLTREYENRLESFFKCALPATGINPYVPFAAGNVPREMFFGRERQKARLQDPLGPAIVYGGRQLGKSSVLRQVQQAFHEPEQERFSFLQEIRQVGAPGSIEAPGAIWERITHEMRELGLLKGQRARGAARPQDVVVGAMREPNRRVLVLLDEADAFLTADAERGFGVLAGIKEAMERTDRRFKVVFAGLHNVGRFSRSPNHPLAHLGTAEVVGPLDPPSARDLVRKPLEALGFRFPDASAVLKILALANYHPGLVQLLCYRLVEHLRVRRGVVPPYAVTVDDVAAIYRDPDLRREIRDRFVWTLDLDARYGTVVRAMILDQLQEQDGFGRSYSTVDLYRLGREWWPKGFEDMTFDHFRDYMEELEELWVLSKGGPDRYRLRSPNLVRLLGKTDEIEEHLMPYLLGQLDPADPWKHADVIHSRITEQPPLYSPLAFGDIRRLGVGRSGVTAIFGSPATGLERIPDLLQVLAGQGSGEEFRHEALALAPLGAPALRRAVEMRLKQGWQGGTLLSARVAAGRGELAEHVEAVLELVANGSGPAGRWLRIVLLVGPEAMRAWSELAPALQEKVELYTTSIPLRRWQEQAVQRRLEEHDTLNAASVLPDVLQVTGGYQFLLDALLGPCETERVRNLADPIRAFRLKVNDPASSLRAEFRTGLERVMNCERKRRVGAISDDRARLLFRLARSHFSVVHNRL